MKRCSRTRLPLTISNDLAPVATLSKLERLLFRCQDCRVDSNKRANVANVGSALTRPRRHLFLFVSHFQAITVIPWWRFL